MNLFKYEVRNPDGVLHIGFDDPLTAKHWFENNMREGQVMYEVSCAWNKVIRMGKNSAASCTPSRKTFC